MIRPLGIKNYISKIVQIFRGILAIKDLMHLDILWMWIKKKYSEAGYRDIYKTVTE